MAQRLARILAATGFVLVVIVLLWSGAAALTGGSVPRITWLIAGVCLINASVALVSRKVGPRAHAVLGAASLAAAIVLVIAGTIR